MAEGDALCEDYLGRLKAALSEVPARDREQILIQIRDHLDEARAALPVQTQDGVQDILDRLGPPEDIALAAHGESEPPLSSKRQGRGLIALTAAFALIALGLGVAALTGAFGGGQAPRTQSAPPARATVPNVLGLNQSQASAVLTSTGFNPVVGPSSSDLAVASGTVTGQSPPAGAEAPRNSRVTISSSGEPAGAQQTPPQNLVLNPATGSIVVLVPNVVGLSQAQAVAELATRGLDANVSNSDGLYVGTETPQAGSSVPSNSEVVIGMG